MIQNCCEHATNVAQQQPCLMYPYGHTAFSTGARPIGLAAPSVRDFGQAYPPSIDLSHGGRRESRMLVAPAASCAV